MGSKKRQLLGQKFGKLTVIGEAGQDKYKHFRSLVKCECGRENIVLDTELIYGRRKSCRHCQNRTHGKTNTRLFHIWSSMIQRCKNPNNNAYKYYGYKGISVCEEWESDFQMFYIWAISNGYDDKLSIDRIDVNGNYEPGNCRWADTIQQARNKSNTTYVDYDGVVKPIEEVAEITGIKSGTIRYRLRNGWNDYDATHIPTNAEESRKRSHGHERKRSVRLTDGSREYIFESCSAASRFLGFNNCYLSMMSNKKQSKVFSVGEYDVELSEYCN